VADVRGGFDVTEAMFITEGTSWGTKPITGAWLHFGVPTLFDVQRRPIFKRKIGLGRQYPSDLILIKEYAELRVEAEMLAIDETVGSEYEWLDDYNYIWGLSVVAATIDLEKHMGSLSIGAKLDLTTDEYILLTGAKQIEYAIIAVVDQPVIKRINFIAHPYTHTEVDYVSGDATRKTFPDTSYIKFGDCDFLCPSSVLDRIQRFELIFRRDIQRRGNNATTPTKYGKFAEVGMAIEVNVTLDFDSTSELDDFLGDTPRDITIKIPDVVDGREINLPSCRWREMRKPIREVDLIELALTAECLGTPTITTT